MFLEAFTSIVLSSSLLGLLSPIVTSRRLLFLTLGLTHVVLLAVASSAFITTTFQLPSTYNTVLTFLVTWALAMAVWALIVSGVDEDVATGIVISTSASLSVIAIYAVLTTTRTPYSLWSYVLGDPLLATWDDVVFQLAVTIVISLVLANSYFKLIYVGLDREYAEALGLNTKALDALLLTLISLGTVAMLKTVGAVLLHVMYVLPGATAYRLVQKVGRAPQTSVGLALAGGILGYFVAMAFDVAPSGAIGAIMCLIYIATTFKKEKGLSKRGR